MPFCGSTTAWSRLRAPWAHLQLAGFELALARLPSTEFTHARMRVELVCLPADSTFTAAKTRSKPVTPRPGAVVASALLLFRHGQEQS